MRHLPVGPARRRRAPKRQAYEIDEPTASDVLELLLIDGAMTELAVREARLARVAELTLFAELKRHEIGAALRITARTVEWD